MYATFFEGKIEIRLSEDALKVAKEYITDHISSRHSVTLTSTSLQIYADLKDRGFVEGLILLIEEMGVLLSGKICCFGEDPKDIWEVVILEQKPFIREIGSYVTLTRSESLLKTIAS